jgi:hypothetical protein
MTEHSELRIPVQDVKLALVCQECKTEVVIDPAQNKTRFDGLNATMTCGVCNRPFDSKLVKTVWHLIQAVELAGAAEVALAARRANAQEPRP